MLNEIDPIVNDKDANINIKTELTPQKTYRTKMFLHWKKHRFIAKKEASTYLKSVSKCYEAIRKQWDKTKKKKARVKNKASKDWNNLFEPT